MASNIESTPSITGAKTMRASAWSITINNPSTSDLESWQNATTIPWVVEAKGQVEQGEEGTPHIQGFLKTQQVRFSQVKKAFPRAHIEVARNPTALAQYVVKDETRVQAIQQVQVATPRLIQTALASKVLEILVLKNEPYQYAKLGSTWRRTVLDWPTDMTPTDRQDRQTDWTAWLVNKNKEYLKANAESLVDEVVENLIESGYMMVEFIMANNQVRTAYKKYLPSIVIRNARQAQNDQEASTQDDSETSLSSPDDVSSLS